MVVCDRERLYAAGCDEYVPKSGSWQVGLGPGLSCLAYRNLAGQEQLSGPVDGSRTDPAVIGVYVDVAAAHDGDYVPAGEAVTVFQDRRDAERGRGFDDQASVVQEHPHAGDDRRPGDQDGVVGDQEEVVQDGRDGTPPAMVSVEPVVTTRRWRQECVIAGAPGGWMQITSTSGARAFTS